jgi:hypothetical protein
MRISVACYQRFPTDGIGCLFKECVNPSRRIDEFSHSDFTPNYYYDHQGGQPVLIEIQKKRFGLLTGLTDKPNKCAMRPMNHS